MTERTGLTTVRCDAAVIGAGPSGATAAYHLASSGLDVALVDRAAFPRDKVCGDLLGESALIELSRLRMHPTAIWPTSATPVSHWRATGISGGTRSGSFASSYADHGTTYVVQRTEFDDGLRRRALDAGARWFAPYLCQELLSDISGSAVAVCAGPERTVLRIEARAIICACGAGRLPWLLPTESHFTHLLVAARSYYNGIELAEETEEIFYRECYPAHYIWLFPLHKGVTNVGIVLPLASLRRTRLPLRTALRQALMESPALASFLAGAREIAGVQGALIRTGLDRGRVIDGRVAYVGDAAGMADPLTGEGIGPAMVSGRLAAEAVTAVSASRMRPDALRSYEAAIWQYDQDLLAKARDIYASRERLLALL